LQENLKEIAKKYLRYWNDKETFNVLKSVINYKNFFGERAKKEGVLGEEIFAREPTGFPARRRRRRAGKNPSCLNWRYVFENIRTDFINGLGGRKGKDRTPLPPASPESGSEKDDFKFFAGEARKENHK